MSEKEVKTVYVKETTLGSLFSDTVTFGIIVLAFWFNYKFIGGNNLLDVLLFICFFMLAIGRASEIKKFLDKEPPHKKGK